MKNRSSRWFAGRREGSGLGFTLIELLTVIAIISLLIGILVPALTKARNQAKSANSRAILKAAGDGLEMFRNENTAESRGDSYPSSAVQEDETENGSQAIFGAQLLVRYLMGKDLKGFVSKKNVPREILAANPSPWAQRGWYDDGTGPSGQAYDLPRSDLYMEPDRLKLVKPYDPADPANQGFDNPPVAVPSVNPILNIPPGDDKTLKQLVMVDVFGGPVLYYAANAKLANDPKAPIASFDGSTPGIYRFSDNALFTGMCNGNPPSCRVPPWDFTGTADIAAGSKAHLIEDFGEHTQDRPDATSMGLPQNVQTFPYYIMNRNAFDSSDRRSVTPLRKNSFILISPGADGRYGTQDDINNLQ